MLKRLNPQFVLAFLVASIFWAGVLGWQASYAPSEKEKQECYEATKKAGRKTEECKTLWEKTTSDPVALFTFVLACSTIGLWTVTAGLYFAGEKHIAVARRAAEAAVEANRAWVYIKSVQFIQPLTVGLQGALATVEVIAENVGRSPALDATIWAQFIPMPISGPSPERWSEIGTALVNEALKRAEGFAVTIFPGQPIKERPSFSVPREDLEPSVITVGGVDRASVCFGICVCYRLRPADEFKYSYRIFPLIAIPMNVGAQWPAAGLNFGLDFSLWDGAS